MRLQKPEVGIASYVVVGVVGTDKIDGIIIVQACDPSSDKYPDF